MQNANPRELMRRAKTGDKEAFSILYDMYFVPIYRYIYYRIQNKEETEDLVQNVFVKVYNSMNRFEDQGKEPLAYFFTVARNSVLDFWKKKKEVLFDGIESKIENTPDENANIVQEIYKNQQVGEIMAHMGELTEDQQEVLTLKYINDMDNNEIAKLMNKTEATIRQIQSRALKYLKNKLIPTA